MRKSNIGISVLMTMAMFLGACAQQASSGRSNIKSGVDPDPATTTPPVDGGRYCDTPIYDVDESTLNDFFAPVDSATGDNQPVEDLEDAPTYCHKLSGYGTAAKLYFMVEYEDRYGIREAVFMPTKTNMTLISSGITVVGNTQTLDAIYQDGMGLMRVRASGNKTASVLSGEITFHNFPATYEEALAAAVAKLAERCRTGGTYNGVTYNAAYCLGYSSTQNWWTNTDPSAYLTAAQKKKAMALEILDDDAQTQVLGTIDINVKANTWP